MFEVHLFVAAFLIVCSIAFRFAGERELLNTIDYRVIGDVREFNRYVGVRMLLPALVAAGCTVVTYQIPSLGIPLIFAVPLAVVSTVVWIGVGSKRFKAIGSGDSQNAA